MAIRFLDRIDLAIAAALTDEERNRLLARRATYLARMGEFPAANEIIGTLRRMTGLYDDVELSVYLTFVDGIVAFYLDRISEAEDRLNRANALSKAAGVGDVVALSSAWLAHLAFGRFDFDRLAAEVDAAFDHVQANDHECLARLCLVIAQTIHLAGNRDGAGTWYLRARLHAVQLGDESAISSIMYNKTVMEIVNCRQSLLWKGEVSDVARQVAVSSAEATDNFDRLVGVVSLGDFTPLLKAQTYSLAGRHLDAEQLYSRSLTIDPSEAQARSRCWLLSDHAYCFARLGLVEDAMRVAHDAIDKISDSVQVDDLAATHARLAAVFSECGDPDRASRHSDESRCLWMQFSLLQASIVRHNSRFEIRYGSLAGRAD